MINDKGNSTELTEIELLEQLVEKFDEPELSEPKITPYLKFVLNFLHDQKINYWMDSGSLLGIIRDGDLMGWDSDIDLGMWSEDIDAFLEHVNFLKSKFLIVKERYYLGHLYGFTIKPSLGRAKTKEIHIHVFYRTTLGVAWSPQTIRPKRWDYASQSNSENSKCMQVYIRLHSYYKGSIRGGKLKKIILKLVATPFIKLINFIKTKLDRHSWSNKTLFSEIYRSGTWLVKSDYFDELNEIDWIGEKIFVPSNVEQYLADRYGEDWREPNQNWVYYHDDGCLHADGPEVILSDLYNSKDTNAIKGKSPVEVLGIREDALSYFDIKS